MARGKDDIFMRQIKWLFLLLTAVFFITGCGKEAAQKQTVQPEHYPGWIEVKAGNDAEFAVPSEIAVENEEFRRQLEQDADTDPLVKVILSRDRAIANAQGSVLLLSTDFTRTPWERGKHYARISFQTLTSPMKLPRYGQNLGMDAKAIREFDNATREGIQFAVSQGLPEGYQIECRNWTPLKTQIINGVEHLFVTYDLDIRRQGRTIMIVNVQRWTFLNNDRLHILTAYTNAGDKAYWNADSRKLSNLVKTLVITPSVTKGEENGFFGKLKGLFH